MKKERAPLREVAFEKRRFQMEFLALLRVEGVGCESDSAITILN